MLDFREMLVLKVDFFESASPTNYPSGASSWWHLIDCRHSNNTNNYAMQISGSFFDQFLYYRKTNNNASQAWKLIVATNNEGTTGQVLISQGAGQTPIWSSGSPTSCNSPNYILKIGWYFIYLLNCTNI